MLSAHMSAPSIIKTFPPKRVRSFATNAMVASAAPHITMHRAINLCFFIFFPTSLPSTTLEIRPAPFFIIIMIRLT